MAFLKTIANIISANRGSAFFVFLVLFALWFVPPVYKLSFDQIEITQIVGGKERSQTIGPATKTWVKFENLPRATYQAIIAAEDTRFYQHHGLDLTQIYYALRDSLKAGHYVRGASTITQQTVKMAFLSRSRSLIRKLREAVGAILVELFYSKSEILEWYINLAEFGHDIYGIHQASWRYYGRDPRHVKQWQAIQMAAVLPSPVKWSTSLANKKLSSFMRKRFEVIVTRMMRLGFIDKNNWDSLMSTGDFGRPVRNIDNYVDYDSFSDEELGNFLRQAEQGPTIGQKAEIQTSLSESEADGAQAHSEEENEDANEEESDQKGTDKLSQPGLEVQNNETKDSSEAQAQEVSVLEGEAEENTLKPTELDEIIDEEMQGVDELNLEQQPEASEE